MRVHDKATDWFFVQRRQMTGTATQGKERGSGRDLDVFTSIFHMGHLWAAFLYNFALFTWTLLLSSLTSSSAPR